MDPILDIRDVSFTYRRGARPALENLTLAVPRVPRAEPVPLRLVACATLLGTGPATRPVVPADDVMQAFIYRHMVPAEELLVAFVGQRAPTAPAPPARRPTVRPTTAP